MVEFEASEAEQALSVMLASLTSYCLSFAGSYKQDIKMAKEAMQKLGKENQELKEQIKKLKEPQPRTITKPLPTDDCVQPPRSQVLEQSRPQNR